MPKPLISRLLSGRPVTPRVPHVMIAGPGAVWAVGDVHGRHDLWLRMERAILAEDPDATIVLVGDIIDRGPGSREMVEHLVRAKAEGARQICLLGNHEDMALRFIFDPVRHAAWLDWGGRAMIASYGVDLPEDATPETLGAALAEAMPADHHAFLAGLPVMALTEGFVITHAGAGPETPLVRQKVQDLVWLRHAEIDDLIAPEDLGGRIVVHGHVPVPEARLSGWRVNVDTGAYATGRLSAARLVPGAAIRFLTVEAGP